MPSSTQPKITRKRGPLILGASIIATARNWREEGDSSREFTRDINSFIELSQVAERGKLHSVFFVDHLTWFDQYGGFEPAARVGFSTPRIDPAAVIVALSQATKNIGFAVTFSTISEHPYHLHRRLATLDALTNGRVGWNIVASFLPSSGRNFLNGEPLPGHDERYAKTEEYLDTVYDLLLSSWRDDSIIYDKENGIFADQEAIRKINHEGKYFQIEGPSITEPTPQRFPVIIQAGTSKRGIEFAAENAELVYISLDLTHKIPEIRRLAKERYNRDPYSIKFLGALIPFIGRTHEEAQAKSDENIRVTTLESRLIAFSNSCGFDLSSYGWDEPISLKDKKTDGVRSTFESLIQNGGETITKRQIAQKLLTRNKFVGTPVEIADQIEELLEVADIDGFNITLDNFPVSLYDIVDLLIPELQKRGLAQTEYAVDGGTFRENIYRKKGQSFFSADHPAYNLRWRAGVSKEQFEKELKIYKTLRQQRRESEA